jgi:hypothetical protein
MSSFQDISDAARERVALADTLGLLWYVLSTEQAEDLAKKAMTAPASAAQIRAFREVLETVNRSVVDAFVRGDSLEPSVAYAVHEEVQHDLTSVGEAMLNSGPLASIKKEVMWILMQRPAETAWIRGRVPDFDRLLESIRGAKTLKMMAVILGELVRSANSTDEIGQALYSQLLPLQHSIRLAHEFA